MRIEWFCDQAAGQPLLCTRVWEPQRLRSGSVPLVADFVPQSDICRWLRTDTRETIAPGAPLETA
jgi:hypothetical protein